MNASGSLNFCTILASGIRKVKNRSITERNITCDYIVSTLFFFGYFFKTAYTDSAFGIKLF